MEVTPVKTTISSESHHWYKRDGSPCHEIANASKKGEMRGVTLRDARKLDLVPSVTTVCNIMSKPGLDLWKQKQVLMAALTLPLIDGESLDDYSARVMKDASEQGKAAAERGTRIHGSIERYMQGLDFIPEDVAFVSSAVAELDKITENGTAGWSVEKSFYHNGYGGKVDLHSPDGIVLDFKTKEFEPGTDAKKLTWPEQAYQLAAYRMGLKLPTARCFNVYVSVNNPGLAVTYEWPEPEIKKGEQIFLACLKLWQLIKGYTTQDAFPG
jgi:hypothetical protein